MPTLTPNAKIKILTERYYSRQYLSISRQYLWIDSRQTYRLIQKKILSIDPKKIQTQTWILQKLSKREMGFRSLGKFISAMCNAHPNAHKQPTNFKKI